MRLRSRGLNSSNLGTRCGKVAIPMATDAVAGRMAEKRLDGLDLSTAQLKVAPGPSSDLADALHPHPLEHLLIFVQRVIGDSSAHDAHARERSREDASASPGACLHGSEIDQIISSTSCQGL